MGVKEGKCLQKKSVVEKEHWQSLSSSRLCPAVGGVYCGLLAGIPRQITFSRVHAIFPRAPRSPSTNKRLSLRANSLGWLHSASLVALPLLVETNQGNLFGNIFGKSIADTLLQREVADAVFGQMNACYASVARFLLFR
jgi:hypothetical protein